MFSILLLTSAVSLAPAGNAAAAVPADPEAMLQRARQLLEGFDDAAAAAILHRLIDMKASSQIVAHAHVYLGIIAANALQPDLVRAEFRKALLADSTVELPEGTSPKILITFGSVRRRLISEEMSMPAAAPPSRAIQKPPPRRRSRAAAWTLGAVAVAAAAVALYGGLQVNNYTSMVSSGPATLRTLSTDQLRPAYRSAQFWRFGWPVAAGLGGAALLGAVLTW